MPKTRPEWNEVKTQDVKAQRRTREWQVGETNGERNVETSAGWKQDSGEEETNANRYADVRRRSGV